MFFRQIPVYVVVLLASLSLTSAHADETDKYFSLAQLQAMALNQSPAFQAIQDQVDAALAGVSTAKAFPNPEIEVSSARSRPRLADGLTSSSRSSSLTQPLDLPNRRWSRIDAAEAGLTAAEANGASNRADLLALIQVRYYELLRREAELKAFQE
ncbi:MAG: outer membrane protein cobalt-zinc-cadmium efflux system, partial [Pseudomonadota bacterium]